MSDTKRTQKPTSEGLLSRLPYQLTAGVTATLEGLQFSSPLMVTVEYFPYDGISPLDEPLTIPWPDVAERLRYREGQPWVWVWPGDDLFVNEPKRVKGGGLQCLDRLAAILCDDDKAFRMLYWCIHNLGKGDQS